MLTELSGKGGCVCDAARQGRIKCPLIIRPTSEDVITGHLFQALDVLNPRYWVSDLLNYAVGSPRFRRQYYSRFRIELWKSRSEFPRELLPWKEGRTEVDVTISWENPPTTVFMEMKYGSDVSTRTTGDDGTSGFPSDQLIRNVRVGLLECGWYRQPTLFHSAPRDFCMILVQPKKGHRLISEYRNVENLRSAIPKIERVPELPVTPFIGEIGYGDIVRVLRRNILRFTAAERRLIAHLEQYLTFKQQASGRHGRQDANARATLDRKESVKT